jgi:uroporphyrinogen decarboxylase
MAITQAWIESAPESIDVLIITDDYGANQNMLISPKLWQTFLKPRLSSIIDFGHRSGMKVMLHSDGSIRKIIPELIAMGIDILNPIEPEAAGMDPAGIKRDYGNSIALHGAASSLNLAHGTPEQLRSEVEQLMINLAPGGGFILCPSNHIMEDMPVENVLTLYDAAYELGEYG